jgi:hypothetical protein
MAKGVEYTLALGLGRFHKRGTAVIT